jgi:hypothetical protein
MYVDCFLRRRRRRRRRSCFVVLKIRVVVPRVKHSVDLRLM